MGSQAKNTRAIIGTHEESFQLLPRLLLVIRYSNPGMAVQLDNKIVDGDKVIFSRVFWAFSASIDGFQYCRPLISIDDTHLYGEYRAKLLITVTYDSNNGVYPLCYAIVKE